MGSRACLAGTFGPHNEDLRKKNGSQTGQKDAERCCPLLMCTSGRPWRVAPTKIVFAAKFELVVQQRWEVGLADASVMDKSV